MGIYGEGSHGEERKCTEDSLKEGRSCGETDNDVIPLDSQLDPGGWKLEMKIMMTTMTMMIMIMNDDDDKKLYFILIPYTTV